MKKLIAILAFILSVTIVSAQNYTTVSASFATNATTAISMPAIFSTLKLTPAAGDTIHGSDPASTTHAYVIKVNNTKPYYFTAVIKLDTIKTHNRVLSNHVWVQVLGSLTNPSGNDGWVAIGSPVKFGASVDSTFSYSDVATGQMFPYLKFRFSGITAAKCSKVASFALRTQDK